MLRIWLLAFHLLAAALAAGCSGEKVPATYGTFLWDGKNWVDISKDSNSISLEVPAQTKILIHSKSIERVAGGLKIQRLMFVRNSVGQDKDGRKRALEKKVNAWEAVDPPLLVEGKTAPVKGHAEMIVWMPDGNLPVGVYEPVVGDVHHQAFMVGLKSQLGAIQSTEQCKDKILTRKFMWENAIAPKYEPCGSQVYAVTYTDPGSGMAAVVKYVEDSTATISPADLNALEARLQSIATARGVHVLVRVIPSTNGVDISQFSDNLANELTSGLPKQPPSAFLLFAVNDRRVRLGLNRKLNEKIPDSIASEIISQSVIPKFRSSDYIGGLNAAISELERRM